jgi:SlyX protein
MPAFWQEYTVSNTEDRFVDIEIKLAYAEDMVDSLSQRIHEQQQQIDKLEQMCASLVQHVRNAAQNNGGTQLPHERRRTIDHASTARRAHHQRVVFGLAQAGDGDGADDAGALERDREGAAVRRVVFGIEVLDVFKHHAAVLVVGADVERAAAEARHHIVLAADPFGLVGRRALHGVVEQHLAVDGDVDR